MSNCVSLRNAAICFRPEELRPEFMTLCQRMKELPDAPYSDDIDEDVAWWFLSANTDFRPDFTVIYLGEGRSTHTWRDLEATRRLLCRYTKVKRTFYLLVKDEDWPSKWGQMPFKVDYAEAR